MARRTIEKVVEVTGRSLHSGRQCSVRLEPAASGTGRRFNGAAIGPDMLAQADFATTLLTPHGLVSTVEHLFAALHGLGIDDVFISTLDGELPILDGSARGWVDLMSPRSQFGPAAAPIVVDEQFRIGDEESWILVEPNPVLSISVTVDFESLGAFRFQANSDQWEGVIDARTFGFLKDAKRLNELGLALGATLDNTLVFDDGLALNMGGLRFDDEVARHKWLDVFGDLYALGRPVLGRFTAYRSGHRLHHQLVKALSKLAT
ncbi:MAG: UDP-3-O-[3-hydroxymyristoyl] N-acetylglucosamine deacetylase [Myxococcales bacterium]|nr:UDP-3-O-[3-hydroxymyristoyl] N-acetylglucosamine deacetylase [Myxococcales bacterium]